MPVAQLNSLYGVSTNTPQAVMAAQQRHREKLKRFVGTPIGESVHTIYNHVATSDASSALPRGHTAALHADAVVTPELFDDNAFGQIVGVALRIDADEDELIARMRQIQLETDSDVGTGAWHASLSSDPEAENFVALRKIEGEHDRRDYSLWVHSTTPQLARKFRAWIAEQPAMSVGQLVDTRTYKQTFDTAERNANRVLADVAEQIGARVLVYEDREAQRADPHDVLPDVAVPDVAACYNVVQPLTVRGVGAMYALHSYTTSTVEPQVKGGVPVIGNVIDPLVVYRQTSSNHAGNSVAVFGVRLDVPRELDAHERAFAERRVMRKDGKTYDHAPYESLPQREKTELAVHVSKLGLRNRQDYKLVFARLPY